MVIVGRTQGVGPAALIGVPLEAIIPTRGGVVGLGRGDGAVR
jgi:hypothetical protein